MVKQRNMYGDSIKQWNPFVGCEFNCIYCKKSFQAQMKRQLHNCRSCYDYIAHFHEDRLKNYLPRTEPALHQFIFTCSSSDVSFCKPEWFLLILERIRSLPDRKFLIQSKDPSYFKQFQGEIPENCHLGITLETNRDIGYEKISKAPLPSKRFKDFLYLDFLSKFVTIEPILEFDLDDFVFILKMLAPERVYIGYDTKKTKLQEPSLEKTMELVDQLKKFTIVKLKLIREACFSSIQSKLL